MKNQKGFSLIELLIVVVIILIIAAIAIPSLLRARMAANESAMVGDIRTVISAEKLWSTNNGNLGYANMASFPMLAETSGGFAASCVAHLEPYLDNVLAVAGQTTKSGYTRNYYVGGVVTAPVTDRCLLDCVTNFTYAGSPISQGRTGQRGYAGDDSGRICRDTTGADPSGGNAPMPVTCLALR
ncbi:MAG: prepilin-type N-terminal cleavage/methylation domain-containing protein [Vicinamibacteria bacterium]|nr:prepilin-type N-terminal cleavage/methylation domain-containing protein [Vicinamibacteria bacterium]